MGFDLESGERLVYEQLRRSSDVYYFVLDQKLNVIDVSPGLVSALGRTLFDLYQVNVADLPFIALTISYEELDLSCHPVMTEFLIPRKSGHTTLFIKTLAGKLLNLSVDITCADEQCVLLLSKQNETIHLHDRLRMFNELFASCSNAVVISNDRNKILQVNRLLKK